MNINLIACAIEDSTLAFPMGALCIKAAIMTDTVLSEHCDCELYTYVLNDDPVAAATACAQRFPDIVGCSIYLWNRPWFDTFVQVLHEQSPATVIFAGGTEVTANGASMWNDAYTFMVMGEGEETVVRSIRQLLDRSPLQGPGIITKDIRLATPTHPESLENLSSPFLCGAADLSRQRWQGVLWEMTRGCPFHCAFCFESKGERTVRSYPIDRIREELDYLVAHDVKNVFVLDPTFNMDKRRTVETLSLLVENAPEDMHFTFELRAELLDEELADLFASIYCALQIGLQSAHKDILGQINRRFDPEIFAQKIGLLNERGIAFGLDLIIGLPGDTFQLFTKSLDYAISLTPSNIDIFQLALLPGTRIAEQAASLGIEHQQESPYLVVSTPTLPPEDLEKALRLKQACDLFYTKGQACMWIHTACDGLGIAPSNLLSLFSGWIDFQRKKGLDPDTADIYMLQEEFLSAVYRKTGNEELYPALRSYMELHQGICFLHDTCESPIIHLDYTPDDLAALDTMPLRKFVARRQRIKGGVDLAIYEDDDGELLFMPADGE